MPSELRTRISIDADGAAQSVEEQLIRPMDELRAKEMQKSMTMARDLAHMSVDEYQKQIEAQERLLDSLRIKQEDVGREERERIAMEFAERQAVHERKIQMLKEEAKEVTAKHSQNLQELEELKRQEDEVAQARAAADGGSREGDIDKIAAREQEISQAREVAESRIQEGRQRLIEIQREAWNEESDSNKDRLETLRNLAQAGKSTAEGTGVAAQAAGGGAEVAQLWVMAGSQFKGASKSLLRILGVGGIAFSLGHVVERLVQANEELRAIRANFLDIAASMGDLAPGVIVGQGTGQLVQLHNEMLRNFGDALDQRIVPTVARALAPGGFSQRDIAGITEEAIFTGVGTGVSPAEIAQVYVKLFRDFEVRQELLNDAVLDLVDAAHEVRVSFQDLTKWTFQLQEQTRIYGYELEDSRRLVTEFARELQSGVLAIGDLVRLQTSLAEANQSQRLALSTYLPQMGGVDAGFRQDVASFGDPLQQETLLRGIQSGEISTESIRGATGQQRQILGRYFDLSSGALREQFEGLNSQLMQGALAISREILGEMGLGAAGGQMVVEVMQSMFGIDLGRTLATQNEMIRAIEQGRFEEARDGISADKAAEAAQPTSTYEEVKKTAEAMLEMNQSMASRVKDGISAFWRDSVDQVAVSFARAFNEGESEIASLGRTMAGSQVFGSLQYGLGSTIPLVENRAPGADPTMVPTSSLFAGIAEAMQNETIRPDRIRQLIQIYGDYLIEEGRTELSSDEIGRFIDLAQIRHRPDTVWEEGTGAFTTGPQYVAMLNRQRALSESYNLAGPEVITSILDSLMNQPILDVDPSRPGVQIQVGDTSVSIRNEQGTPLLTRDRIEEELGAHFQGVVADVINQLHETGYFDNGSR